MKRNPSPITGFFLALLACLAGCASARAAIGAPPGVVRLLDGRTLTGKISIDKSGKLIVERSSGKTTVDLRDLLEASFVTDPEADHLQCGLALTDGGTIAADSIPSADPQQVTIMIDDHPLHIPTAQVARILFHRPSPSAMARVPAGHPGALLADGDFMEGQFQSLANDKLRIMSLLFGASDLDTTQRVTAAYLADVQPRESDWIVRWTDGTRIMASSITLQSAGNSELGTVNAVDATGRTYAAFSDQIAQIRRGPAHWTCLADLAPNPLPENAGYAIDAMPTAGPAMQLQNLTISRGIGMSAGTSAGFDLPHAYRAFACRVGVPANLAPSCKVHFVILANDREVYRSPDLTSVDEPAYVLVQLAGITHLNLRLESDQSADMGAVGIWANPYLIPPE